MIKHDPTIPVYFFFPPSRRVVEGRFHHVSELGYVTVYVSTDGYRKNGDIYFSQLRGYNFTNKLREAKRDAMKYFREEIAIIWKDMVKVQCQKFTKS